MPSLVARKKTKQSEQGSPRVSYEVRTVYLPFFLAANQDLLRHVDKRLKERFQGRRIMEGSTEIERESTSVVIDAILEKNPVKGLREVLEALEKMQPGQVLPDDEIPNLEPPKVDEPEPPKLGLVTLDEALEEEATAEQVGQVMEELSA